MTSQQVNEEERAELLATIQGDHVAMKTWYNDATDLEELKSQYGTNYPTFWRDVVDWAGWKDVRKAYLNRGRKRRKKSRWASVEENGNTNEEALPTAKTRKSRWARVADNGAMSTNAATPVCAESAVAAALGTAMMRNGNDISQDQQAEISEWQAKLRVANEKLENLEVEAARVDALPRGHPDRSPSPPPIYDANGIRKNTRAVRWKETYTTLRQDCLERLFQLQGGSSMSASGVMMPLVKRKRSKKIYIPVEEHPTYNFIGLIIGPRGKTQKEMEAKTNCKIAIRGKGSIKEGARGRRDGQVMEGDDEPLHVVITGDDPTNVDTAAEMIQQMLVVIDDDVNVHKQQQLRELALLNGTLKEEDTYCQICAEKGHRAFECPKRFNQNNHKALVKCAICGDTSHPTRDCTLNKQQPTANVEEDNKKELDQDYLSFMAELDGKPHDPTATESSSSSAPAVSTNNDASIITTISTRIISATGETKEIIAENPTPATDDTTTTTTTTPSTDNTAAEDPTNNKNNVVIPTVKVVATTPIVPVDNAATATATATATTVVQPPLPPSIPATANVAMPPPPLPPGYPSYNPHNPYYPPPQQQQAYYAQYPPPPHPQAQYHHHPPLQQAQQQQTWDYRSYFGTGDNTGGDANGAGGFNWWESGDQNE